jgi:alkylresorcinol/alkylpyrone synthase
MAVITTITTTVPPYKLDPEEAKRLITDVFPLEKGRQDSVARIIDKSGIISRYSVFPSSYMKQPRDFTTDNIDYQEHSLILGRCVVEDALREANLKPTDVDIFISVSCTGILMPSLDAYLINQLGFRPNITRLPITELGCMGGAAAITRAFDFARAYPHKTILILAVELTSLTYQHDDPSPANLVSSAIFGDGAACVIMRPDGQMERGISVIDVESAFFPDSLDAMGFDMRNEGLHIVLSKDVPTLVKQGIKAPVDALLARNGLARSTIDVWALHPGGRKILEYLEEELEVSRAQCDPSWAIMRDYGNMSSVTILFVLAEWLYRQPVQPGSYGVMMAFGPGLSAELALLRW